MAIAPLQEPAAQAVPVARPPITASLLAICQALGSSLALSEVLETILRLSLAEMSAQQGSILLFDPKQDQLRMLAAIGLPEDVVARGYIPRKGSIAEWVMQKNQPLILSDTPARAGEFEGVKEGRRRPVSAMCVPLRAGGAVIGTINLNRTDPGSLPFGEADQDMMLILAQQAAIFIENSRLHETLLQSERLAAIGQTVAGISHCIKNVLTGVKGGFSLVEMAGKGQDWSVMATGMDILKRNLDRMSSIVLDMLDYSKERVPMKGNVNVRGLIEEVLGTVHTAAEQKKIKVEREIDPEAACVMADGQQLFRCLLNLVHNAIDATPAESGGHVMVRAERTDARAALHHLSEPSATAAIVIRVCDSGPGIPEEIRGVLFEPFFSTKGSKGTGLGLAVTRKIICEHGGSLEIESAPGEPAVFAIYLPG